MKIPFIVFVICSVAVVKVGAQNSGSPVPASRATVSQVTSDSPYVIVDKDGDSRVWQRTTYEQGPSGEKVPHVHRYTELATGLNYQEDGQWTESREVIEIQPQGGAAAVHGQHKVYFPYDIYDGVIEMFTPDGKHLVSRPLGISYNDGTNSVLIGQLKHSIGQILPSGNQVIYTNAFTEFAADLVCTYRKSGFESDVVFREQPPTPESFGLSSDSASLEVFTEFFDPPVPKQIVTSMAAGGAQMFQQISGAHGSVIPRELPDASLDFGGMTMVRGKAFDIGEGNRARDGRSDGIPVSKSWTQIDGRNFLIEAVPVPSVQNNLKKLPIPSSVNPPTAFLQGRAGKRILPPSRIAIRTAKTLEVAKNDLAASPGLVMDYQTLLTSTNSFTFKSGSTYEISGAVIIYGPATFEGTAVIKYDNLSSAWIYVGGTFTNKAAPYRMVIFTSKDDDTVGEPISGSSGSPINTGATYLQLSPVTSAGQVSYMRFAYAGVGLVQGMSSISGVLRTVQDCQFIKCYSAIGAGGYPYGGGPAIQKVYNVLFSQCGYAVTNLTISYGVDVILDLQQITADKLFALLNTWSGDYYGVNVSTIKNSILTTVTNEVFFEDVGSGSGSYANNFGLTSTRSFSSGTGVFQVVGGGSYYLVDGSTNRDAGSAAIDSGLFSDIQKKTSYPPTVYQGVTVSTTTTYNPLSIRDNDGSPDLGYHYDPLDYAFAGVDVNADITFAAGTVAAWFTRPGDASALHLENQKIASFAGTMDNPSYFVHASTAQEGENGNWTTAWGTWGFMGTADQNQQNVSLSPELRLNFTLCSAESSGEQMFKDYWGYLIVRGNDSTIIGGNQGGYIISYYLTNCLIDGAQIGSVSGWTGNEMYLRNCTMHGGVLYIIRNHSPAMPVSIRDCALDGVTLSAAGDQFMTDTQHTDFDYNAYTNSANFFPAGCVHDKKSVAFNWQTGPLGYFYLPSPSDLIDAGDVGASTAGLHYFTTQTNQLLEGDSQVDIGYHYSTGASESVVTISAMVPDASEVGPVNGVFAVKRPDGDQTADLTVYLQTPTGTATSGSDYVALPTSVTIPANSDSALVTLTPISDLTVEGDEQVTLALATGADYSIGSPSSATITIKDGLVNVVATDPVASQAGAWGEFTVSLPQVAGGTGVDVSYNIGGDAANNTDYSSIASPLHIPAGSSSATILIKPKNNTPYVGTKHVTLTLTGATGYAANQISASTATVTIVGDGAPSGVFPATSHPVVTVVATDADAREDTGVSDSVRQGTFTFTRTNITGVATNRALNVRFQVSGTATYGVDYNAFASSNIVTIPAGATNVTLTVIPIDDAIPETAETVSITLRPDADYDVGAPSNAVVVIDDNEAPTYTVVATDPIAIESPSGGGHADPGVFTVTRTGSVLNSKSIKNNLDGSHGTLYYSYGGSATLNSAPSLSDYVPDPGFSAPQNFPDAISFGAHVFTKQVTVTPISDARNWVDDGNEGTETITLTVTDSSAGHSSSDTVQLYDMHNAAPSPIALASADPLAIRSPSNNATFNFSRNSNGDKVGAMDIYFRLDGQATLGLDYALSGGSVTAISGTVMKATLPAGNAAVTITLLPINNATSRGVQSVIVSMLPGAYQFGSQVQAALRISDTSAIDFVPDTDHDGINDTDEIANSTDPLTPDTDGNGFADGYSSKSTLDTNGDGITDGMEILMALLPTDFDGDGLDDLEEVYKGTDPSVTTSTSDTTPPTITLTSPTSPKVVLQ